MAQFSSLFMLVGIDKEKKQKNICVYREKSVPLQDFRNPVEDQEQNRAKIRGQSRQNPRAEPGKKNEGQSRQNNGQKPDKANHKLHENICLTIYPND